MSAAAVPDRCVSADGPRKGSSSPSSGTDRASGPAGGSAPALTRRTSKRPPTRTKPRSPLPPSTPSPHTGLQPTRRKSSPSSRAARRGAGTWRHHEVPGTGDPAVRGPAGGLRWRDLHSWWQDTHGFNSESDAGEDLYQRLLRSLPGNSPGQKNLFTAYRTARPFCADDLALLPEVWLHWDPKTVKERGPEALLRSRMDFLLLLPFGQRVVLEVDGVQHYTRDDGRTPDTAKYAEWSPPTGTSSSGATRFSASATTN